MNWYLLLLVILPTLLLGYTLGQHMFVRRKFIVLKRHRLYTGRTLAEIEEDLARFQFTRNRLNEEWHRLLREGESTIKIDNALSSLEFRYEDVCEEHEDCLWHLEYSSNEANNPSPPSASPYR